MASKDIILKWDLFLRDVRAYFYAHNYNEVYTPTLVLSPGVDAAIDFWQASWGKEKFYLPTSPEISMKKLLSLGLKKIFEIKNCFRGDYISKTHLHEFHMLEWYWVGGNFVELKKETCDLIIKLSGKSNLQIIELKIPQFFQEKFNFAFTPNTNQVELLKFCQAQKIDHSATDTFRDLFNRIYMEKIESEFDPNQITILSDFPAQLASLAQINERGWADRFEVYWKGHELANAFNEQLDASENRKRFFEESKVRENEGKAAIPLDEDFFKFLEQGVKPTVGIALGLERLFMCINDIDDIQELKL